VTILQLDKAAPGSTKVPTGLEPAALVARNVSCWFGTHKVLERISLVMQPRRVTALIGPSGCGKSTFLRSLNRLHELIPGAALAGSVEIDGVDIYGPQTKVTETRLRIGMVFQKPNPFPSMTIAQNVLSGLRLSGTKTSDRDSLVEDSLRRAGLWKETRNRLNTPGAALSGGQQQRLCIAVLGPRPHLHPGDRGDHHRAQARHDDRHRHPQHAAGSAGVRRLRPVPHRQRGRPGPDRGERADHRPFLEPAPPADCRLRKWSLRLSR